MKIQRAMKYHQFPNFFAVGREVFPELSLKNLVSSTISRLGLASGRKCFQGVAIAELTECTFSGAMFRVEPQLNAKSVKETSKRKQAIAVDKKATENTCEHAAKCHFNTEGLIDKAVSELFTFRVTE